MAAYKQNFTKSNSQVKQNQNKNLEIHELSICTVPRLMPSEANSKRIVADGLQQLTKISNFPANNAVCTPIQKRAKTNSGDWSTDLSINKIFHRHGAKFKKLFQNLSKPVQEELIQFLIAEVTAKPLTMVKTGKLRGMRLFEVVHNNRMSYLDYEKCICSRFLYKIKNQFSDSIEITEFYAFLMAGSKRKRVKYINFDKLERYN